MKRFMICLTSLAFVLALAAGGGAEIAQRETLYVDDGDGEPFYTETGWKNRTKTNIPEGFHVGGKATFFSLKTALNISWNI